MLDDHMHAGCGGATSMPPRQEACRGGGREAAGRLATDMGWECRVMAGNVDAKLLIVLCFYNLELLVQMRCTFFSF